jgi:hypothetical protein
VHFERKMVCTSRYHSRSCSLLSYLSKNSKKAVFFVDVKLML